LRRKATAIALSAATVIAAVAVPTVVVPFTATSAVDTTIADTLRANNKINLIYWADWQSNSVPWGKVTSINYAFGSVNASGTLGGYQANRVQSLASERDANDPNVRLFLSIGGATWSMGSNYWQGLMEAGANNPALYQTFANNCVAFLKQYNYQGIDIDYEFPSSNWSGGKAAHYTEFIKCMNVLNNTLDAENKGYQLTMAGSAGNWTLTGMGKDWVDYFDYINIMSYDLYGSWDSRAGHQAGLYQNEAGTGDSTLNWDWAVNYYLNTLQYPASKIVMGVPYYSYGWKGATALGGSGTGIDSDGDSSCLLPNLEKLVAANPSIYHWDDKAKVPYVIYNNTFYTYEDERSIQEKADYINSKNLAGVMCWEISGDPSGKLTNILATALYTKVGGTPITTTATTTPAPTTTTRATTTTTTQGAVVPTITIAPPTNTTTKAPSTTTTAPSADYPNWNDVPSEGSGIIINVGDRVVYENGIYESLINQWWKQVITIGEDNNAWKYIGPVSGGSTTTATTVKTTNGTAATTAVGTTVSNAPTTTKGGTEPSTGNLVDDMSARNRVNIGYYDNWGGQKVEDLQWGYMTHVNYAFVTSYRPLLTPTSTNLSNMQDMAAERDKQAPNTKLLISVGGANDSAVFAQLMNDGEAAWIAWANSAVDVLKQLDFQGIDIDYESPSKTGWSAGSNDNNSFTNYCKFLKVLREVLKAANPDYLLTSAVTSSLWVLPDMAASEYTQYLDYVNIMTYDLADGGAESATNHDSPLYGNPAQQNFYLSCDYAINYFLGSTPPEKIVLGTPLYSDAGNFKNVTGTVSHDEISKVAYISGKGDFGDFWSIEERVKYVEAKNLAGLMYWDTPADIVGTGSLIRHAGEVLAKASAIDSISYPFTSTNDLAEFEWYSVNPSHSGVNYQVIITNNTGKAWANGAEIQFSAAKVATKSGGVATVTATGFSKTGDTAEEAIFTGKLTSAVANGADYTLNISGATADGYSIPLAIHEIQIDGKYSAAEFLLKPGEELPVSSATTARPDTTDTDEPPVSSDNTATGNTRTSATTTVTPKTTTDAPVKFNISDGQINGVQDGYDYLGVAIIPDYTVVYGNDTLVEGEDYTAKLTGNNAIGVGTLTITGIGDFVGTLTQQFKVNEEVSEYNLTNAIVTLPNEVFTENSEPKPTVEWFGNILIEGEDYDLHYIGNDTVGNALVIVEGKGEFHGKIATIFTITDDNVFDITRATVVIQATVKLTRGVAKPIPTLYYGDEKLSDNVDFTLTYLNNTVAGNKAGVIITGKGSYVGTLGVVFNVA
jgi:chitinase